MEFTDEQLEDGRLLFTQSCEFVMSVTSLKTLPPENYPEVAFAGRSNVGKSTLVNALTGRKTLARTSNTPGRTQHLNFFNLGHRVMLVDMPGHGYARASKTDIAAWTALVRDYLRGRPNLKRLCLLVDSRHGLKDTDRDLMDMLDEAGVAYQLVLTKADKVKTAQLENTARKAETEIKTRAAAHPFVFVTSAEKGQGVAELRALLADLASPAPLG